MALVVNRSSHFHITQCINLFLHGSCSLSYESIPDILLHCGLEGRIDFQVRCEGVVVLPVFSQMAGQLAQHHSGKAHPRPLLDTAALVTYHTVYAGSISGLSIPWSIYLPFC